MLTNVDTTKVAVERRRQTQSMETQTKGHQIQCQQLLTDELKMKV